MQKNNAHAETNESALSLAHKTGTRLAKMSEIYKHLNFKVPPEFHREFKTFAASHDISMTALLIEAFNILREQSSG